MVLTKKSTFDDGTYDGIIIRFEPQGYLQKNIYDELNIEQYFRQYFAEFKNYKYIGNISPTIGPQFFETPGYLLEDYVNEKSLLRDASGFCAAWSTYFCLLQLLNPNVPPQVLAQYSMSLGSYTADYEDISFSDDIDIFSDPAMVEQYHQRILTILIFCYFFLNCYDIGPKVNFVKRIYPDEHIKNLYKEYRKTSGSGWLEEIKTAKKSNFFRKISDKCIYIEEFVENVKKLGAQTGGNNYYKKYKQKYLSLKNRIDIL